MTSSPEQMRVLVTAAGSGPGVSVIKALKRSSQFDPFVLAVDMRDRASGLYLADAWRLVPAAREEDAYVDRLIEVCNEFGINMLLPIFDIELPVLAAHSQRFEDAGVFVALNSMDCVLASNDKDQSYRVCERDGISQPQRYARVDEIPAQDFPVIGKRTEGIGGKGMVKADSRDVALAAEAEEPLIWQRFIEGAEYTIDCWGDPESDWFVAVPRVREMIKAGQMVEGHTLNDPELSDFARQTYRAFGAHDVGCVQVIRNSDGDLFFIEINPRYGTGVSLSIAAGIVFPDLQWLHRYRPDELRPEMLQYKAGLAMTRYWEEIYL